MRFFLFILLTVMAFPVHAQTVLKGSILSTNGEPAPITIITAEKQNKTDLFAEEIREITYDGNFQISFDTPGIYLVRIRSVFHNTVNFPFLVFDQEAIETNIFVQPLEYNNGRYFSNSEYLDWIRVYGNFNHYNYHDGIPFSLNKDGSVSAFIPAEKDTIRYQIRGLTPGVSVLPGADSYSERPDGTFEAVITKPAEQNSIELRYNPAEEFPFPRYTPRSDSFWGHPSSFFHFNNTDDQHWIKPLLFQNNGAHTIHVIDTPEPVAQDFDGEYNTRKNESFLENIARRKKQIENILDRRPDLHEQQIVAYYMAYAGLLAQEKSMRDNFKQFPSELKNAPDFDVNLELVNKIFRDVPPVHPLWAGRNFPLPVLAELAECSREVIRYAEQMVVNHARDDVFRETVLFLTRLRAWEYSSVEDLPYYHLVLERYGNRNLARVIRKEFQKVAANNTGEAVCHRNNSR